MAQIPGIRKVILQKSMAQNRSPVKYRNQIDQTGRRVEKIRIGIIEITIIPVVLNQINK
jgi:hypothetical protein